MSREQRERNAWEAGFRLCRAYGDNHPHFDGEQKERQWQAYWRTVSGEPTPPATPQPETSERVEVIASEIAKELFSNGFGDRGDKLTISVGGVALGGWSLDGAARQVRITLEQEGYVLDRMAEATRRASLSVSPPPASGDVENLLAEKDRQIETIRQLNADKQRLVAAAYVPQPQCRDCADENGRCPRDGTPCDPFDAAIERFQQQAAQIATLTQALEQAIADTRSDAQLSKNPIRAELMNVAHRFADVLRASRPTEGEQGRLGNYYGRRLTALVDDGQVVVAIGVQTLAHAVAYADWANPFDEASDDYIRTFAIADAGQFAKDVVNAMLAEREDGSTPLSDFLDKMSQAAIEDGSLGLHEDEHRIKHGETAPCETWAEGEQARDDGHVRLCDARHPETGATCELPMDHDENHRGAFRYGIAQWPYEGEQGAPQ